MENVKKRYLKKHDRLKLIRNIITMYKLATEDHYYIPKWHWDYLFYSISAYFLIGFE